MGQCVKLYGVFTVRWLCQYEHNTPNTSPSYNQSVPKHNCFCCLQSCCTYLEVISAARKNLPSPCKPAAVWRVRLLFLLQSRTSRAADHRSPAELQSLSVLFLYLTCCLQTAAQCSVLPLPESHPQDVERHGSEADGIFLHGGRYQQHPDPQPWWGPPPPSVTALLPTWVYAIECT